MADCSAEKSKWCSFWQYYHSIKGKALSSRARLDATLYKNVHLRYYE